MPPQATAQSWAIDNSGKTREFLSSASPQVIARLRTEESFHHELWAMNRARNERAADLREEKNSLISQIQRAESEVERGGTPYRKETVTTDPKTGTETVTVTADPYIEDLKAQLGDVVRQMKENQAQPLIESAHEQLKSFLHSIRRGAVLVDAVIPPVELLAGEDEESAYARVCAANEKIKKEIKRVWDIPHTADEIMKRVEAEVKATAKTFSLGGLIRGHGHDSNGRPTLESPKARIGWPEKELNISVTSIGGAYASGFDAKGFMCAMIGDTIIAKAKEYLKANLPAETMTAAQKRPIIEKLLADQWNHWRVVEEYFLAARARGFKVKRLQNIPTEILLGIEKVGKSARIEPDAEADNADDGDVAPVAAAPKAAPEKPAVPKVTTEPPKTKAKSLVDLDAAAIAAADDDDEFEG